MKRKLLILLLSLIITALSLTACFSQDNTPPSDESDEIVVYSESVKAAVVVNMFECVIPNS